MPTWAQLGSQNLPKMEPSWLQKPSKRQSSEITKTLKNHWFFKLFGGFGVPSWSQNRSKINSERYLKQDVILNRFLMALGPILGRFWRPSWDQVGSKIGPRRDQNRYQNMVKKMIENLVCEGMQGDAGRRGKSGCWSLRTIQSMAPGNLQGLRDTPLRARGTVADIDI